MQRMHMIKVFLAMAGALLGLGTGLTVVMAVEPCGGFGECKVLIEINATDGDIGFHFLMDGDDLVSAKIVDPNGKTVFANEAKGALRQQKLTELFGESAEPLCWADPAADPDEDYRHPRGVPGPVGRRHLCVLWEGRQGREVDRRGAAHACAPGGSDGGGLQCRDPCDLLGRW